VLGRGRVLAREASAPGHLRLSGAGSASGRPVRPAAGAGAGRPPWAGRRVLLGVTGGIAAYKSIQLARDLALLGAEVDVVLTRSARAFVGGLSFEAVTGRTVIGDILVEGNALGHIRLARESHVVCVVPATADFMARAASGQAGDMLTAVLLATRSPVLICPAMNDAMWSHPQTQANVARLAELGYRLVGPAAGPLAFGEGSGPGRVEEPGVVLEHIGRALAEDGFWVGRRVVVTAGPTREPVDAVRVLTNRSSGRMGFAIAAAAWRRGADVTLIAGPTTVAPPPGPSLVSVETAEDMLAAVRQTLAAADVLFMAAAVADFRPVPVPGKMKKSATPAALQLEPAPDVLKATIPDRRPATRIIGFALETGDGRDYARAKLREKELDVVVLNPADVPGAGFDAATNRVTIMDRTGGELDLPVQAKEAVAEALLDYVARLDSAPSPAIPAP
jgi:phosphopantothenoylcysteine decarboxylase / phosphopantothenate---cysteine ligase